MKGDSTFVPEKFRDDITSHSKHGLLLIMPGQLRKKYNQNLKLILVCITKELFKKTSNEVTKFSRS